MKRSHRLTLIIAGAVVLIVGIVTTVVLLLPSSRPAANNQQQSPKEQAPLTRLSSEQYKTAVEFQLPTDEQGQTLKHQLKPGKSPRFYLNPANERYRITISFDSETTSSLASHQPGPVTLSPREQQFTAKLERDRAKTDSGQDVYISAETDTHYDRQQRKIVPGQTDYNIKVALRQEDKLTYMLDIYLEATNTDDPQFDMTATYKSEGFQKFLKSIKPAPYQAIKRDYVSDPHDVIRIKRFTMSYPNRFQSLDFHDKLSSLKVILFDPSLGFKKGDSLGGISVEVSWVVIAKGNIQDAISRSTLAQDGRTFTKKTIAGQEVFVAEGVGKAGKKLGGIDDALDENWAQAFMLKDGVVVGFHIYRGKPLDVETANRLLEAIIKHITIHPKR